MMTIKQSLSKFSVLFLMISTVALSGCTSFPRIYSGESIHGWVIDAKTKQPVKDVVVVEVWELQGGWHTDHTANIHIAETLTDEEGYYVFPDWGPKFTTEGVLSRASPFLTYYKFGYEVARRQNSITGNMNPDNSVSEHSAEKIDLVKFEGEEKLYAKKLASVYGFLQGNSYREPFKCMWKKVPVFTSEIIKAERYFRKNGIYSSLPRLGYFSAPECSDPEEILKDYL